MSSCRLCSPLHSYTQLETIISTTEAGEPSLPWRHCFVPRCPHWIHLNPQAPTQREHDCEVSTQRRLNCPHLPCTQRCTVHTKLASAAAGQSGHIANQLDSIVAKVGTLRGGHLYCTHLWGADTINTIPCFGMKHPLPEDTDRKEKRDRGYNVRPGSICTSPPCILHIFHLAAAALAYMHERWTSPLGIGGGGGGSYPPRTYVPTYLTRTQIPPFVIGAWQTSGESRCLSIQC